MAKKPPTMVTDENPINVGASFNFTLLEMVKDLLRIKGDVQAAKTQYGINQAYTYLKDGVESVLMYLIWSNRYDPAFLEEQLRRLEGTGDRYDEKDFNTLKDIIKETGKTVSQKSPLDRDVTYYASNETMSRGLK